MSDQSKPVSGRDPVESNIPCLRCGYNLRGLEPLGRCPECGDAVAPSIEAHRAAASSAVRLDAKWARRARVGAIVLLAAGLLCQLQNEDLSALFGAIGRGNGESGYHDRFDLAVYALSVAGLMLLTTSTAVLRRGRCLAFAWIARVVAVVGLLVVILPVVARGRIHAYGPLLLGRLFLTLLASTSLYAYLGTLFRYSGRRGPSRLAFLVAGLFPLQNLVPILSFASDTLAEQFDLGIFAFTLAVPGVGPRGIAGLLLINLLRYPGGLPRAPDGAELSFLTAAITTWLALLLMVRLAVAPSGRQGPDAPAPE